RRPNPRPPRSGRGLGPAASPSPTGAASGPRSTRPGGRPWAASTPERWRREGERRPRRRRVEGRRPEAPGEPPHGPTAAPLLRSNRRGPPMKRSGRPKVVVVTGASSGVGRACVRAFAERGADVALLARGRDGLEAAAKEVEAAGRRALVLPLDVADADAVDRAAQRAEDELGPIDVWVNSAMTAVLAP